jgi:hypothetical protein
VRLHRNHFFHRKISDLRDKGRVRLVNVLKVLRLEIVKLHEIDASDDFGVPIHACKQFLNLLSLLFDDSIQHVFIHTYANFLNAYKSTTYIKFSDDNFPVMQAVNFGALMVHRLCFFRVDIQVLIALDFLTVLTR